MGLDMYAYAIDARMLEDDAETDFNPYKAARRAVGFLDLPDKEVEQMSEADRKVYWDKLRKADIDAEKQGWINTKLYYWRKFNALHGWMHELYISKGGTDPDFNCNTVRLDLSDLEDLMQTAEKGKLKPTNGFFFGAQEIEPEDLESIFDFAYKAKAEIAAGRAVFYDSWW
jgi:hypothetical protein